MNQEVLLPIITNLGTDYRCYKMARALKNFGYIPIILCDKPRTPLGPAWQDITVRVISKSSHLESFTKTFFRFHFSLIKILIRTKSNIWISEDCPPLLTMALIGKVLRKNVIYDSHELFLHIPKVQSRFTRKIFWSLWHNLGIKLSQQIITVSPLFVNYYQSKFPDKKITLLPNVPEYNPSVSSGKVNEKKVKLVYQGYLRPDSQLDKLLYVIKEKENLFLTIIGEGEYKQRLEKISEEIGIQKQVKFKGLMEFEKIPAELKKADIGVNILNAPEKNMNYTWGNKIFDYLQLGLPTLAGPTEGLKVLLEQYIVGVMISDYTKQEIIKAIEEIISNYDTLHKKCLSLKKELSWEEQSKIINNILS